MEVEIKRLGEQKKEGNLNTTLSVTNDWLLKNATVFQILFSEKVPSLCRRISPRSTPKAKTNFFLEYCLQLKLFSQNMECEQ